MPEVAKCPLCGNALQMDQWKWPECTMCPFQCALSDLPRISAAMELAKAVLPIVEYYEWLVSDEDGVDPDDVIVGSKAHPHFTGKDMETIKRLYGVFK